MNRAAITRTLPARSVIAIRRRIRYQPPMQHAEITAFSALPSKSALTGCSGSWKATTGSELREARVASHTSRTAAAANRSANSHNTSAAGLQRNNARMLICRLTTELTHAGPMTWSAKAELKRPSGVVCSDFVRPEDHRSFGFGPHCRGNSSVRVDNKHQIAMRLLHGFQDLLGKHNPNTVRDMA